MTMNRRHWILGAASLSATGWLTACSTSSASRSATPAGFVARQVGEARVIAVSDGVGKRALDAGFVKNAPLEQVQAALQAAGLPTTHIDVPYTCFVIEHQGKRYLLDTGFGDNGPAGTGLLHTHMRAAGIDPSTIDAVIISHMHGDHINGLRRKDGSLIYPKALVYVPQPEMAFWMDDARMHAAPEGARAGFMAVRRVFNNYPGNQLKLFVPGSSILPGLDTIASFGHSPGHSAIAVQSGKERFVYIGDVAHYPALFVRHPDWQVQFDMHPEQARATRHHLLTRLAQEQSWVGGYHFPLPSIGHIQKTSTGFDWLPGR